VKERKLLPSFSLSFGPGFANYGAHFILSNVDGGYTFLFQKPHGVRTTDRFLTFRNNFCLRRSVIPFLIGFCYSQVAIVLLISPRSYFVLPMHKVYICAIVTRYRLQFFIPLFFKVNFLMSIITYFIPVDLIQLHLITNNFSNS
jgi:hypothetical protein